ncbi:MAG: phosphoadenosine phosphosulfate reductase family protein [Candidatus Hodgkinia cicadicola]
MFRINSKLNGNHNLTLPSSACRIVRLLSNWFNSGSILKVNNFRSKLILLTSLSAEDQLLLFLLTNLNHSAITINTNLLFPKTLNLLKLTTKAHGGNYIMTMSPKWSWVLSAFAKSPEVNVYDSLVVRLRCCHLRKVETIARGKFIGIRIVGVRAAHSPARQLFKFAQWDDKFNYVKFCALSFWHLNDIMQYLWSNSICYNSMHDVGFKSIGCSLCTRAIKRHESARAGRWWWEAKHRLPAECGLHVIR